MNITELCHKYSHWNGLYGTDKSTTHHYAQHVYENEFAPYKDLHMNLLEVGIYGGYSVKVWSEYFTNATIYGLDISPQLLTLNPIPENVRIVFGDGTKPDVFESLPKFTLVVDDASHAIQDQIATFNIVFPKMEKGGLYIIEDIQNLEEAKAAFEQVNPNFEVLDIREHSGRYDDIVFLYRT